MAKDSFEKVYLFIKLPFYGELWKVAWKPWVLKKIG